MRDQRQQAIREILTAGVVATQSDLLDALAKRGHEIEQSTLSRDLAEIRVRKTHGRYELPGDPPQSPGELDYAAVVRGFLPCGPHQIVIRTDVGQAQPIALWMDKQDEPAIVATLAGDDTIFIATKNSKTQAVALRRLEAWFGDKRER